jgi:hypothetical protein
MVIADFIVAPFLAAGALWLIRMGVNIWRSPGGDSRLQLMVMGWDRAVLMMGIFLMWLAVAALGQAVLDVTKVAGSQLGLWRRLGRNVRVCLLVRKHLVLQQAAVSGPTGVAAPAGHASCRERLLGPDHPDTLLSRNNLANAYQDAGRTDEAITLN